MEKVKLQIEILKIKLTFFSGIFGGVSFMFLNIEKLEKIFNIYILYLSFGLMLFYSIIGIFTNMSLLSDKYKELNNV